MEEKISKNVGRGSSWLVECLDSLIRKEISLKLGIRKLENVWDTEKELEGMNRRVKVHMYSLNFFCQSGTERNRRYW